MTTETPDYRNLIRERLIKKFFRLYDDAKEADAVMAVIAPLIEECELNHLSGGTAALRAAAGMTASCALDGQTQSCQEPAP